MCHQVERFAGQLESKSGKARFEFGGAQNSNRVFGICVRYVTQDSVFQISHAVEWIDEIAIGISRHSVDRQVATTKICLQRYIRRCLKFEPVITRSRLSLGSRERVFFVGFRVQKNRKALANLTIACGQKFIGSRTHDAPVPFFDRQSKLFIPNSTANKVNFHWLILAF